MRPDFDDLPAFARAETELDLPVGVLRPRLLLFHDGQPTVYVRSRTARPGEAPTAALQGAFAEMALLAAFVRPAAVAAILQCRLREVLPDAGEVATAPAEGPCPDAVIIQRGRRHDDGAMELDAAILPFGRDEDGRPRWGEPMIAGDGPCTALVRRALGEGPPLRPADRAMTTAGAVYALTKFGHVIGVDARWRARLELDVPVEPRWVRPADRDRARRLQQRVREHAGSSAAGRP